MIARQASRAPADVLVDVMWTEWRSSCRGPRSAHCARSRCPRCQSVPACEDRTTPVTVVSLRLVTPRGRRTVAGGAPRDPVPLDARRSFPQVLRRDAELVAESVASSGTSLVGGAGQNTLMEPRELNLRPLGCDASAAVAPGFGSMAVRLCGVVSALGHRGRDRVGSDLVCAWCARGGLSRIPGGAGLPCPSAEAAGGVKKSP